MTIKVLKPTEEKRQELRDRLIVVCVYKTELGEEVLGIDYQYKPQYPDFQEVDVLPNVENPNYIWHDESKSIQIVQSNDDCLNMLETYPEIAIYRRDNMIETIRENNFVFIYVNELLPEHKLILEEYNAVMNEK